VIGVSDFPFSTNLIFNFGIVSTVWYFLELFLQCGNFWNCFYSVVFFGIISSVVFFGIVSTVWYFLELFLQCGIFWNCFYSVVFLGIVSTVWYFLELFLQCGIFWNCFYSVVFFAFHFITLIVYINKLYK
jgi:hypothetical protein